MARIDLELSQLEALNLNQLRDEWRRTFDTAAPQGVGRHLLASGIATRLQEERLGGLTAKQIRMSNRFAEGGEGDRLNVTLAPTAGTRLVREWRGVTHHVEVKEEGFSYKDQNYASLSPIAERITGARWSGPRFFGLVKRRRQRTNSTPSPTPVDQLGGVPPHA
jgi:hypothetical protein